eukprot:TRINITY_DN6880_c0_g1_i5.p3 TRINITY_DN6880_c0_g1~~TRINITY_DN6880_c0_g1_i5.p3  ORF type:complete len:206 (-),score=19.86 TRINITY_DN6880_c0_g1_i5:200-817(-)
MYFGQVRIELFDTGRTKFVNAHNSKLQALSISIDGKRIATASEKGTLIRVFDTNTGEQLQELRRGAEKAQIFSIAIAPKCDWLAVSSDKGTIHIFALRNQSQKRSSNSENQGAEDSQDNQQRTLESQSSFSSSLRGYLPAIFNSERSIAQYRLNFFNRSIVGFGPAGTQTLSILCSNGECRTVVWDPVNGGTCKEACITKFVDNS